MYSAFRDEVNILIHERKPQCWFDRLVDLVVKASASRAEDPGFESRLRRDISSSGHISGLKIDTQVATLPGAWQYRVSAGLFGPVSVHCDWVRWKVGSATSISMWQHVNSSEQIRP